jgi:hypothetical protein
MEKEDYGYLRDFNWSMRVSFCILCSFCSVKPQGSRSSKIVLTLDDFIFG